MISKSDNTRAWTLARAMVQLLPANSDVLYMRQNDGRWMVSPMDLGLLSTVVNEAKATRSSQIEIVELRQEQAEALDAERLA